MPSLQQVLVAALRDESNSLGCSGLESAMLRSDSYSRIADQIERAEVTDAVVVPPGAALVVRIDPEDLPDPVDRAEFVEQLTAQCKDLVPGGFRVLVVVARQIAVADV